MARPAREARRRGLEALPGLHHRPQGHRRAVPGDLPDALPPRRPLRHAHPLAAAEPGRRSPRQRHLQPDDEPARHHHGRGGRGGGHRGGGGRPFLVPLIFLRAPGMTWTRLPIFVWSIVAAAILALTFTQFFAAAMLLVTLDRIADTSFFKAAEGGAPLLYQHVFWFYSHPAVYIFGLAAVGLALGVLTLFAQKPLFAYRWAVGGLLG